MKIAFILGTRPEVIKLSPIIKECRAQRIDHFLIHSGQHFTYEMDKIFFEQLELDPPKFNINTSKILNEGLIEKNTQKEIFENPDGCIHHGKQLGLMLGKIEEILFMESPDFVLVQGVEQPSGFVVHAELELGLGQHSRRLGRVRLGMELPVER